MTIRVVVAEDSFLLREALRTVLRVHGNADLVATVKDVPALLFAGLLSVARALLAGARRPAS